jgi:hypothetical protein
MRFTRRIGILLLAIWLILWGLNSFLNESIPGVIMAILAIAAGVLLLFER